MYSKFFDNAAPLPFHLHHRQEHAELVGKRSKPEAYFFPTQMNDHLGEFPYTFFGLHPEVTRKQLAQRLRRFQEGGDNQITELARAYRVSLGTGWDVPAGLLHAPASVCTYEPQSASDVFAMAESWSNHREVPNELMWKDVPEGRQGDIEFILDLIDWDLNQDPLFFTRRFTPPIETSVSAQAAGAGSGYRERWIAYRSDSFSAKELTVGPGTAVTITEDDAYGLITIAGRGSINGQHLATAHQIRFGQLSHDEFFVTAEAASGGVAVVNSSPNEDLVVLKHFGPGNDELRREWHGVAQAAEEAALRL
ncbi:hypothetical protein LSI54_12780 [Nesterenkonia sp. AY15]|uniref:hypothetical protein n=1 Tax=Nesterenkonia sp. AY15 TaxID=2901139 RepID=UPI001F4CB5E0|nr:hypothetical protein [Nesterenkonia sp. AY15]MCH8572223.1 hypothetical protein [Nesterenkonia sp. AY15]